MGKIPKYKTMGQIFYFARESIRDCAVEKFEKSGWMSDLIRLADVVITIDGRIVKNRFTLEELIDIALQNK